MASMKCGISGEEVEIPEVEEDFTGVVHCGPGDKDSAERALVHFMNGKPIFARSFNVVCKALKSGDVAVFCPTKEEAAAMSEDLGELECPIVAQEEQKVEAKPEEEDGLKKLEEELDLQLVKIEPSTKEQN